MRNIACTPCFTIISWYTVCKRKETKLGIFVFGSHRFSHQHWRYNHDNYKHMYYVELWVYCLERCTYPQMYVMHNTYFIYYDQVNFSSNLQTKWNTDVYINFKHYLKYFFSFLQNCFFLSLSFLPWSISPVGRELNVEFVCHSVREVGTIFVAKPALNFFIQKKETKKTNPDRFCSVCGSSFMIRRVCTRQGSKWVAVQVPFSTAEIRWNRTI